MFGALLYLRFTSFKNWLRGRLRRLRQPKYAIGAVVGAAYVYYFFIYRFTGGSRMPKVPKHVMVNGQDHVVAMAPTLQLPEEWLPFVTACGAFALLLILTISWLLGEARASLGFSEAEIAFLFPAPVTQRQLVHFKLLGSQFSSLVGAIVLTAFSNRWGFLGGNALTHAFGWWFVLATLNLHFTGMRFTLARLASMGLGTWRRRALIGGLAVVVLGATYGWATMHGGLPPLDGDSVKPLRDWVVMLANTPPLGWLLWPTRLAVAPFLAPDVSRFLVALAPAFAVLAVQYFWVVRSVVSFEEGSIAAAEKRAARVAAIRSGDRRLMRPPTKGRKPPFALASTGRPELAFLWKNLLSTWPWFSWRAFRLCAAVIVIAAFWLRSRPGGEIVLNSAATAALVFLGYTLLAGPQLARQDLRSDLANADLLKTYPLPGWQILLGELLAPTAILTGIAWLAILVAAVGFHAGPKTFMALHLPDKFGPFLDTLFAPAMRTMLGLCVAFVVPPLAALQLFVPNGAALIFPAWYQASRTRGGGIDMMGQRMIFFFVQLLTMLVALVPALLVAGVLGAGAQFLFHLPPIATVWLGAVGVVIALVGELWLGVYLLGQQFEKFDLSAELRA